MLAGVYGLPEEVYCYQQNCFAEFYFTLLRNEKRFVLIVGTANEFLGEEENIRKILFFDVECDNTPGEK